VERARRANWSRCGTRVDPRLQVQHTVEELSCPFWPCDFQDDRIGAGLDGQLKSEKAATLPLDVHNLRNPGEDAIFSLQSDAISVRQIDALFGASNERAKKVISSCFERGWAKCASDWEIRHLANRAPDWTQTSGGPELGRLEALTDSILRF
jgi:hypothetical protein